MASIQWHGSHNEAFDTLELYPDQLHHIRKVLSEMEKLNQRIAVICRKARDGK
jgi:hypothetical protein